jgi:hypothetical protein
MPARASHIPHHLGRTTLQKMNATHGLSSAQLHPAGQHTIARLIAKGWIEKQMDAGGVRYRITPAGAAALKAKIPTRLGFGDVSRTSRAREFVNDIGAITTSTGRSMRRFS